MAKKNPKKTFVDSAALAAAADQESTPNQLCALAAQSPELARITAANPAIDASVVEVLKKQKDPKVNRALAANPGTPLADLLELGKRYTGEFVQNPIFDLALAADPRFISKFPETLVKNIITNQQTSENIILWCVRNAGGFEFAKKDKVYEWVGNALKERASLSEELVCKLIGDKKFKHDRYQWMLVAIANRTDLSEELAGKLFPWSRAVSVAIANRIDLSEALAAQVLIDCGDKLDMIAQSMRLSQVLVRHLSAHAHKNVRLSIATRDDLPTDVIARLSSDADEQVRKVFAPTDLSWCEVLRQDPDPTVVTNPELLSDIFNTDLPWRVRDIGTGIEMLLIPPGTFQKGKNLLQQVKLTKAFYLGRYLVTQSQWQGKMGNNPSHFKDKVDSASRPVEKVSWNDIAGFSTETGLRLPTIAEWEYACRAGTTTALHSMPGYPNGTNDASLLGNIAWYSDNSGNETHTVGGKAANAFGLYDVLGNVMEWVEDYQEGYYNYFGIVNIINPIGPAQGSNRVVRGGSYRCGSQAQGCSAFYGYDTSPDEIRPDFGFRVARTP